MIVAVLDDDDVVAALLDSVVDVVDASAHVLDVDHVEIIDFRIERQLMDLENHALVSISLQTSGSVQ